MKDETLRTALQNWEHLSSSEEEYIAYEARLKRIFDEEAAQREAELRLQEAELRVQEEKQNEKEETARRLLASGADIETIIVATELDKERVIEIKREMQLP